MALWTNESVSANDSAPPSFAQEGISVSFLLTRKCLGGPRGFLGIKGQERAKKKLDNIIQSWTVVCDREMRPGGLMRVVIIDLSIGRATTVMNSIPGGTRLGRRHTFPCVEYSVRFGPDTICRFPDIPLPGHGTGLASRGRLLRCPRNQTGFRRVFGTSVLACSKLRRCFRPCEIGMLRY